ncbi:hypothetical protein MKZ26_06150 [Sporosarcina sp. FSL K6-6792]|uniref:hypothetical protein n=1 Tax=Sporosarcina sp. FSL K6-6792 TaxID=2921559 RepID=UPI0030F4EA02
MERSDEIFNRIIQQQKAMQMALESPMKQLQQQQKAMQMALESPMKQLQQQQKAIRNSISASFMNAYKVNSFSIDGGIAVLDNIVEDIQGDSNSATLSTQYSLDLSEILNDFIESYWKLASLFKNGYNAITNNNALLQLTTLIGLIGSIITIVSTTQGNSVDVDIHIHNNFEEVKVKTEKYGKKVDIYIEKKELPLEPNSQDDDKWVSGGDRT